MVRGAASIEYDGELHFDSAYFTMASSRVVLPDELNASADADARREIRAKVKEEMCEEFQLGDANKNVYYRQHCTFKSLPMSVLRIDFTTWSGRSGGSDQKMDKVLRLAVAKVIDIATVATPTRLMMVTDEALYRREMPQLFETGVEPIVLEV